MTAKQLYEGLLIELNKENAPNLLLEDFNYFANRAVNQYINKRYNIYDMNQQTTDDLRVLKATAILIPTRSDAYDMLSNAHMATYYVDLPSDYLHLLNCICIYQVNKTYKCYNAGDTWRAAATRLTADNFTRVLDNFWLKPTYKRPYYYIHNVNTNTNNPTNPYTDLESASGTDVNVYGLNNIKLSVRYSDTNHFPLLYLENPSTPYLLKIKNQSDHTCFLVENKEFLTAEDVDIAGSFIEMEKKYGVNSVSYLNIDGISDDKKYINFTFGGKKYKIDTNYNLIPATYEIDEIKGLPKSINIGGLSLNNVERIGQVRYGNVSKVRLEIRYGTDDGIFTLGESTINKGERGKVYIDYIKAPQHIRLTQEELDYTEDFSQMLEFPDYVCQEILNELVHIVMENISDQRLQTHPVVSQSIANPAQAQAPEAAGKSA